MKRRPIGSGLIRGECVIKGCNRLQKLAGRTKGGQPRYKPYCQYHCRIKYGMPSAEEIFRGKKRLPNKKCEFCGWNKAFCDRHRLDNKSGYHKENVVILCPNCHRLVHCGIIDLKDMVKEEPKGIPSKKVMKEIAKDLEKEEPQEGNLADEFNPVPKPKK